MARPFPHEALSAIGVGRPRANLEPFVHGYQDFETAQGIHIMAWGPFSDIDQFFEALCEFFVGDVQFAHDLVIVEHDLVEFLVRTQET